MIPGKRPSARPVRRRPRSGEKPAPPPRKADLRRADLVRAAIALLIDRGLPDSPVDDIAAHAGVAKGTFYHYFASKADLMEALRAHFIDDFQARVVAAVDARPVGDWNGRFEAWIVAATDSYFDMHALHDLVFHGPSMPHRQSMGDADIVRHLAALLAAGRAAGVWSLGNEEPIQVAALIFHGLHGMVDDALASGALSDRMGTRIARLTRRMLAS
ncbi:MAG TPA: TetR/AcrR family transcriptional regulator [Sphingopyxis sp.]|nr:TetR/AcrR family transcriptional regulator [Sphingopyxis sp.]